ncbi:hypothetical protein BTW08_15265 [Salinicola sp. MH3R3-1]|uniref:hypothetical protein n=1 Tax=Salinicola sp. MH3R3-1 TaxID=1928762 RepID=UPI00094E5D07|nr:hypothetical protein [Salinicola sp. MH3R3-1]OLO06854.1 hypothetical protein BTW08_15265 [Salinicola sp. MH3R3-1]
MSQQRKDSPGKPCTISLFENEHGGVSVDAGFEVGDPRNLTTIQALTLVGVTAIHEAMIEYSEKAMEGRRKNETTH